MIHLIRSNKLVLIKDAEVDELMGQLLLDEEKHPPTFLNVMRSISEESIQRASSVTVLGTVDFLELLEFQLVGSHLSLVGLNHLYRRAREGVDVCEFSLFVAELTNPNCIHSTAAGIQKVLTLLPKPNVALVSRYPGILDNGSKYLVFPIRSIVPMDFDCIIVAENKGCIVRTPQGDIVYIDNNHNRVKSQQMLLERFVKGELSNAASLFLECYTNNPKAPFHCDLLWQAIGHAGKARRSLLVYTRGHATQLLSSLIPPSYLHQTSHCIRECDRVASMDCPREDVKNALLRGSLGGGLLRMSSRPTAGLPPGFTTVVAEARVQVHYPLKCKLCACIDVEMMVCGKCRAARYCSKKCQLGHWKVHKKECLHFNK
jgi:hypothetical protein